MLGICRCAAWEELDEAPQPIDVLVTRIRSRKREDPAGAREYDVSAFAD